ncbi:MAG: DNA translocase FtsK 4TM domain-containing protein, partial [Alphaproteobacteria bacterium]|nr:DNA translocase FtsK 4TM domain-containing protein [Alphaproteobacteria bacterium]
MSQAGRRIMAGGVYQPRSRGAAMQDALADARRSMARLLRLVIMRGAGLLLLLAGAAALLSLLTYSSTDGSLNNATGVEPSNLFGGVGATAADILLQSFGLAAVLVLLPLLTWGFVAMRGQTLKHVFWRGFAWPIGTVLVAAGLGVLPALLSLPAGNGGLIGIAVAALSHHVAQVYGQSWIGWLMPMLLLATGLPLAFLATGLRLKPIVMGAANVPALFVWAGSMLKMPSFSFRKTKDDHHSDYDHDDEDDYAHEARDEDRDDAGYELDVAPEPIAATRLAERQQSRVKREEARRASTAPGKKVKQPALDLVSGEYQLPSLTLLHEAVPMAEANALSDEALEENARMLEAVLTDFGVKGRIMAVRPGPVVTLYEFEPAAGVKSSRVISLSDDVARSMSAVAARIATIPGRNVIGIELPNHTRETVYLREMRASAEYDKARAPLTVALGKTI